MNPCGTKESEVTSLKKKKKKDLKFGFSLTDCCFLTMEIVIYSGFLNISLCLHSRWPLGPVLNFKSFDSFHLQHVQKELHLNKPK